MPIWVRILILLVVYLIFNFFYYFYYKARVKKNDTADKEYKKSKKQLRKECIIEYIVWMVFTALMWFFIYPNHIMFSYCKIFLVLGLLSTFIGFMLTYILVKKKNCFYLVQFPILMIMPALLLLCSVSFSINFNWYFNPEETTVIKVEEYVSVGPTMDVFELENDKDYHTSIGYNTDTGDYFYYFRATTTGKIYEKIIPKEDIISKETSSSVTTSITIKKTTCITTKSEYKKSSKYYEEETVKEEYKLLLNPNEIVPVSKN